MCEIATKKGYEISFIATLYNDHQSNINNIKEISKKSGIKYKHRIDVNDQVFMDFLKESEIDLIFLCWWPQILKKNVLDIVNDGFVNIHPSYLPFGRGKFAYFWAIYEGFPFGVTIHLVDEGVDTGPILFQRRIQVNFNDSGEDLYRKGLSESIKIFNDKFKDIVSGNFSITPQDLKEGTSRHSREIEPVTDIDPIKEYNALELINLLKGRSFSGGPSSSILYNGKKYYLRLKIEEIK